MKNDKLLRYELFLGWLFLIAIIFVMMGDRENMKDIDDEKYLLCCGSCNFKKGIRCKNIRSGFLGKIVFDDCSCIYYVPRKRGVADLVRILFRIMTKK